MCVRGGGGHLRAAAGCGDEVVLQRGGPVGRRAAGAGPLGRDVAQPQVRVGAALGLTIIIINYNYYYICKYNHIH